MAPTPPEERAAADLCVAAACPNPAVRGGYCWDHMPPAVFARFDGPNVQGHRQRQAPYNRFWRG